MVPLKHRRMILVLASLVTINAAVETDGTCHGRTNHTSQIAANDGAMHITVRYGHFVELDCCADNNANVTWLKFSKKTDKWETYQPVTSNSMFFENKHILIMKEASSNDKGLYKCVVKDIQSPQMKEKAFQVDVVACDMLARGPYPIAPLPCPDTLTEEGAELFLPCFGYFGCVADEDINLNIVTWLVTSGKGTEDDWKEATTVDNRYTQNEMKANGGSVKGANLTITRVKSEDFSRKFMCLLASPQEIQGQTTLLVKLRQPERIRDKDASVPMNIIIVFGILLVTSLVVIFIVTIWKYSQTCSRRTKTLRNETLLSAISTKSQEDQV